MSVEEVAKIAIEGDYVKKLYAEMWENEAARRRHHDVYLSEAKGFKKTLKAVVELAKNAGIPKEVFMGGWQDQLLQEKRAKISEEMIQRNKELLAHIQGLLGDFVDTDLGRAAIARVEEPAPKEANPERAVRRKHIKPLTSDELDSLVDGAIVNVEDHIDRVVDGRVSNNASILTGPGGIKALTH